MQANVKDVVPDEMLLNFEIQERGGGKCFKARTSSSISPRKLNNQKSVSTCISWN